MEPVLTESYALYHGDSCELLPTMPAESVHLSIYSPPFMGLYHYSSSDRDLSNCRTRQEFFEHYHFIVRELARVTVPGRISAVHCMDVPQGSGTYFDFPGEIIRVHENHGWDFIARHAIWKEPLGVRMRTMAQGLAHKQVVEDSSLCDVAAADYLVLFRKHGKNAIPIRHDRGLLTYAGSMEIPPHLQGYRGWAGHHTENSYSHWIWRRYASAFWDDIRIDRVLPFQDARDPDDEKHVHPLQLDVIERILELRSNPGETVLTPFMGVGSEVYAAVLNQRRAIGVELKASYFRQAVLNVQDAERTRDLTQAPLFATEEVAQASTDHPTAPKVAVNPNRWKK